MLRHTRRSFSACLFVFALENSYWHCVQFQSVLVRLKFVLSGVIDGEAGVRTAPPDKLNVKTDPHLTYILVFCIILAFSSLLLFCVFGAFSGDFEF